MRSVYVEDTRERESEAERERERVRESESEGDYAGDMQGECEDIDAMWGNKSRRENV